MSAVFPQANPHSRELFDNNNAPGLSAFGYEKKESRSSYDIGGKKKRRAPKAPAGLGQYKPKILSAENATSVPVNNAAPDTPVRPPRPSKQKGRKDSDPPSSNIAKPIIMGDKDTPMTLHAEEDDHDLDLDVSDLKALTSSMGQGQAMGTENPLFKMHEEDDDEAQEEQVMDFADENGGEAEKVLEPEGVYIPAPDYDEEEKTMSFADDPDDEHLINARRAKQVYKEYDGEDFAQYLSDEEISMEEVLSRSRRPVPVVERKAKTEAKRTNYKKRESLLGKNKNKSISGASSLRDFSYADSKFGTVSGSKKRQSMPTLPEGSKEAELYVGNDASYEEFLRIKNGEAVMSRDHQYVQPQSGEFRRSSHTSKDTLWKKFTWKFKKPVNNSFNVTASS